MIIRPEQPADEAPIRALLTAAFADHPHGSGTEHLIVDRLRQAGVLTLSLVAADDRRIVGHVAFSPVRIADGSPGWYGLGPLAVGSDRRRRGIGAALATRGLEWLRQQAAAGCVVLGEPAYYARFGFAADPALQLEGVPPRYFLALPWHERTARGAVTYHPAFGTAA